MWQVKTRNSRSDSWWLVYHGTDEALARRRYWQACRAGPAVPVRDDNLVAWSPRPQEARW